MPPKKLNGMIIKFGKIESCSKLSAAMATMKPKSAKHDATTIKKSRIKNGCSIWNGIKSWAVRKIVAAVTRARPTWPVTYPRTISRYDMGEINRSLKVFMYFERMRDDVTPLKVPDTTFIILSPGMINSL